MRTVSDILLQRGIAHEVFFCPMSPSSIDAVLCKDLGLCIIDGTYPHEIEPKLYDCCQTVLSLSPYCNMGALSAKNNEIARLTAEQRNLHARSACYKSSAAALLKDTYSLALCCTDCDKCARFAKSIFGKLFRCADGGKLHLRTNCAVTPKGVKHLGNRQGFKNLFVLNDKFGACGGAVITELISLCGQSKVGCYAFMHPLISGVYTGLEIPALDACFTVKGGIFGSAEVAGRNIHSSRFTNEACIKNRRLRFSFNEKTALSLIAECSKILLQASDVHQRLEDIYYCATDYKAIEENIMPRIRF